VQRGNGRQRIFFTHGDCRRYVDMLAQACHDRRLRCLAWYLMPNHIHLVLVPANAAGLRSAMSSVHTRYAQRINAREGSSEHLVQDRFRSYPMDQAHLMTAVRYIESNPVKAGLAASAEVALVERPGACPRSRRPVDRRRLDRAIHRELASLSRRRTRIRGQGRGDRGGASELASRRGGSGVKGQSLVSRDTP
jgi:REP element-mobilizing transposase RayT